MTGYLVSITPESDGTADTRAQISIRVETDGDVTRIVEMTVRSTAQEGLSLQLLPQLDLAAVGRALIAGVGIGSGATAVGAARAQDRDGGARQRRPVRTGPSESAPAAAAKRQGTRRTDRAYRKMPDVGELMATYAEIGSVTGLAERYGVPRHTAQGWMGRARKLAE